MRRVVIGSLTEAVGLNKGLIVSLNQTWVHLPMCSGASLTPGCSKGKRSLSQVPSKEYAQLCSKDLNSLMAFREKFLKIRGGKGALRVC